MGIWKRRPYPRRGRRWAVAPNHPGLGVLKGERFYVRGTVGEVKRRLDAAGVAYKRVRLSAYGGIVEVLFTQWNRLSLNPWAVFFGDPDWRGRLVRRDQLPTR